MKLDINVFVTVHSPTADRIIELLHTLSQKQDTLQMTLDDFITSMTAKMDIQTTIVGSLKAFIEDLKAHLVAITPEQEAQLNAMMAKIDENDATIEAAMAPAPTP